MKKSRDIQVKIDDVTLNCRVAGIIIHNGKVLFPKRRNNKFWALPGEKISIWEKSGDTVIREIKEETGVTVAMIERIMTISEYFFEFQGEKFHQYIFAYKVNIGENEPILKMEEFDGKEEGKDMIYKWLDLDTISVAPIKPDYLDEQLSNISDNIQFNFYHEQSN